MSANLMNEKTIFYICCIIYAAFSVPVNQKNRNLENLRFIHYITDKYLQTDYKRRKYRR